VLTAFIGSILNGLFSGFFIAFITGWISMLACVRIVAAGIYEFYLTGKAGSNFENVDELNEYRNIEMNAREEERLANHPITIATNGKVASQRLNNAFLPFKKLPVRDVSAFGWLGWTWSAVYTPISQTIWIATNISSQSGFVLIVRALSMSVSALGLTFDYKQRYGAAVGRKWGSWAFILFNVWNATACLLLGIESMALLIFGAYGGGGNIPIPIPIVYLLLCIFWAYLSWRLIPPVDGARPCVNKFADVAMGAFSGIFCAAPALILWQGGLFDDDSGLDLGEFLKCDATVLRKFAAIMP
jgi:hypothetical protein